MSNLVVENVMQSFDIPESLFGYTYHALMIPPYPMKTALHLGWGDGNVAALMDKIWPAGCEHTGVDIREPDPGREPEIFFKREAWEFVDWSEKVYDYIVVDIYKGNRIPDFVFSEKFVDNLSRLCGKMLSINCTFYKYSNFEIYGKYFVPDACKSVNDDRVLFMLPKGVFENGKEKA